jgi:WD40 repeat protein
LPSARSHLDACRLDLRHIEYASVRKQLSQKISELLGHKGAVKCVALSANGKRLYSGGDKTIKLWDLETGKDILPLRGHFEWVSCLALSPDGQRLYSRSEDTTIRAWDLGER